MATAMLGPWMAFFRPSALSRLSTLRQFMRMSQSAHSERPRDKNLVASQKVSPSYPPRSIKSLPRPLVSQASHRTSQPTKIRNYPDRDPTLLHPRPVEILPEAQSAPNLAYFVSRTRSNSLPIYLLAKRGGNLKQTRVKKIAGNVDELRNALQTVLKVPEQNCVVNRTNGHVVIKGWHKPQLEMFFKQRRF